MLKLDELALFGRSIMGLMEQETTMMRTTMSDETRAAVVAACERAIRTREVVGELDEMDEEDYQAVLLGACVPLAVLAVHVRCSLQVLVEVVGAVYACASDVARQVVDGTARAILLERLEALRGLHGMSDGEVVGLTSGDPAVVEHQMLLRAVAIIDARTAEVDDDAG